MSKLYWEVTVGWRTGGNLCNASLSLPPAIFNMNSNMKWNHSHSQGKSPLLWIRLLLREGEPEYHTISDISQLFLCFSGTSKAAGQHLPQAKSLSYMGCHPMTWVRIRTQLTAFLSFLILKGPKFYKITLSCHFYSDNLSSPGQRGKKCYQ